jgi:hypothetical protein
MYGYTPPEQEPTGSWSEVLLMIKVVFQMLAPLLGIMAGALLLLILAMVLFFRSPILGLIPLAIVGGVLYWLARRDRRAADEQERRLLGPR